MHFFSLNMKWQLAIVPASLLPELHSCGQHQHKFHSDLRQTDTLNQFGKAVADKILKVEPIEK